MHRKRRVALGLDNPRLVQSELPRLRVGKPFFCEAWRLACVWARRIYTSLSRGSKRKADKNVEAGFNDSLALGRETPPSQPQPETRETDFRGFHSRHSRFSLRFSVSNVDNNNTHGCLRGTGSIPWGLLSVVCNASHFATSFLLVSQTTSVAAAASCMATSYTTTKLSQPTPMFQ